MTTSTVSAAPAAPAESKPESNTRTSNDRPHGYRFTGVFALALHHVPTVIVMAALAALGAYGHSTHWKLPRFSELTGSSTIAPDDWCEEHAVPESSCVECNPDLFPPGPDYGWCKEHGVHNCPLHHPDVVQLKETPVVPEDWLSQSAGDLSLLERTHNNAACKVYQRRIQFASVEAVRQAGIDVELVDRQPVSEWVSGNGEIRYDATRLASLSSRVPGTVWRVFKNIGDRVREGEVLAVVDAMEVGHLKANLVKALVAEDLAAKNYDRLSGVTAGAVPGKQVLEAEAVLSSAQAEVLSAEQALANLGLRLTVSTMRGISQATVVERLRFLGIPQELASEFATETATANLIPIRSPMDGVIVQREIVAGEVVDPADALFQVADPSRMWLMLNIPNEQAGLLTIGQPVRFLPNGSRQEVTGTLDWISTSVDRQTRMLKVRAVLDNPDGRLRDETFGTGRVILREAPDAIVVPSNAVQWEGCCQVVFVRDKDYFSSPESPKLFHVRSVRTGASHGGTTEILAGLLPGEVVVTEGSDVLRAQLLKNSLGAGCCAE